VRRGMSHSRPPTRATTAGPSGMLLDLLTIDELAAVADNLSCVDIGRLRCLARCTVSVQPSGGAWQRLHDAGKTFNSRGVSLSCAGDTAALRLLILGRDLTRYIDNLPCWVVFLAMAAQNNRVDTVRYLLSSLPPHLHNWNAFHLAGGKRRRQVSSPHKSGGRGTATPWIPAVLPIPSCRHRGPTPPLRTGAWPCPPHSPPPRAVCTARAVPPLSSAGRACRWSCSAWSGRPCPRGAAAA